MKFEKSKRKVAYWNFCATLYLWSTKSNYIADDILPESYIHNKILFEPIVPFITIAKKKDFIRYVKGRFVKLYEDS